MASTQLTLKLLIDTKREKVLFAEASKDVVDFLFNLLQLPLGTVVRLLTKKGVVGSLGNLYGSVENLNESYLQAKQVKDVLLQPRTPVSSNAISALLSSSCDGNVYGQSKIPKLYMCGSGCVGTVTEEDNSPCSQVFHPLGGGGYGGGYHRMTKEVKYISKNEVSNSSSTSRCGTGFVKDVVTYMVMDNLVIQPMSTISTITLLNQFDVKDVGVLKEKVVALKMDEGLKLLKASLQSEMVLTTVFMKNMGS